MAGGKIFISYRRADSQWAAARLYDRLSHEFPDDRIFMDVEQIAPGQDFVDVLASQVGACDVFLALIGPEWLSMQAEDGARRIDGDRDFVRIEIADALKRDDTLTIPVLLDGAEPPSERDLPDDLKPLARRQFARLTHEGFREEAPRLIEAIRAALARRSAAAVAATPKRSYRGLVVAALGLLVLIGLGAFAFERLTRPPDPSGTIDLATFQECEICPQMVAMPAGTFLMGSPEDEEHRSSGEPPQIEIALDRFAHPGGDAVRVFLPQNLRAP
ncbi:MAG: TIR domain-containing protein, partial [Pseudomonadota bacterium]